MQGNPFFVAPGNDMGQALSGLSNTMSNVRQDRMVAAEKQRADEKEAAAAARMQEAQAASQAAFQSGDPSEVARASLQFPEIREGLTAAIGLVDEAKQKEAGEFAKRLLLANPADRSAIYQERITALTDQGRDPSHTVQSFKDYSRNPNGELQALESTWAAIAPKEYMVISDQKKAEQAAELAAQKLAQQESQFNRAEAGRNARAARNAAPGTNGKPTAGMQDFQYYQQLKKEDPAAAESFGAERGFISKEGQELSGHLQKRLSTATDDGIKAERNASEFLSLADQIEGSELSGGYFGGTVGETIKDITGSQDAVTELKKRAQQVRASQVMANLPPGAASDPDVAMAKQPMPSDNASKEQWGSWLRGVSKLEQYNADFNNFKAEYISDTGNERGMLKAWKERGGAPSASGSSAPQEVTTAEQFDALPSGAVYLEDGVQYRKP